MCSNPSLAALSSGPSSQKTCTRHVVACAAHSLTIQVMLAKEARELQHVGEVVAWVTGQRCSSDRRED